MADTNERVVYEVWEAECAEGHKTYHPKDPDIAYCPDCKSLIHGVICLVPDWEVGLAVQDERDGRGDARELLDECWIAADGGYVFDHERGPGYVRRAREALEEK